MPLCHCIHEDSQQHWFESLLSLDRQDFHSDNTSSLLDSEQWHPKVTAPHTGQWRCSPRRTRITMQQSQRRAGTETSLRACTSSTGEARQRQLAAVSRRDKEYVFVRRNRWTCHCSTSCNDHDDLLGHNEKEGQETVASNLVERPTYGG